MVTKRKIADIKGGSQLRLATPSYDNNGACSSSASSGFLVMGNGGGSTSTSSSCPPDPPMTIFYNGIVHVYHVPIDKAEAIMRMAEVAHAKEMTVSAPSVHSIPKLRTEEVRNGRNMALLNADLPLARKLSLQRFFERRKGSAMGG